MTKESVFAVLGKIQDISDYRVALFKAETREKAIEKAKQYHWVVFDCNQVINNGQLLRMRSTLKMASGG